MFYKVKEGSYEEPLPGSPIPGYSEIPLLWMRGRLNSTRGGCEYNWQASPEAKRHLSAAPYEPWIDVILAGVEIEWLGWHGHSRAPKDGEMKKFFISQGGSGVIAPFALVAEEAFSDRPLRRTILEDIRRQVNGEPPIRQGNLAVWRPAWWGVIDSAVLEMFRRGYYTDSPVTLFNHAAIGRFDCVVGCDNMRLVHTSADEEGAAIVSPDHWREPIPLSPGTWHFFSHPFPEIDRGAD